MTKFSSIEKTRYGMTYLVAFPDENGIDTIDGINDWVDADRSNRQRFFTSSKVKAVSLLKSF